MPPSFSTSVSRCAVQRELLPMRKPQVQCLRFRLRLGFTQSGLAHHLLASAGGSTVSSPSAVSRRQYFTPSSDSFLVFKLVMGFSGVVFITRTSGRLLRPSDCSRGIIPEPFPLDSTKSDTLTCNRYFIQVIWGNEVP